MVNVDFDQEETLGRLINFAGRLRMLSHRIVLFALLTAREGDVDERQTLLETVTQSLGDFRSTHNGIIHGDRVAELPPLFSPTVIKLFADADLAGERPISKFITAFQEILENIEATEDIQDKIKTLSLFVSTDLLAFLNSIADGFKNDLDRMNSDSRAEAADRQKVIGGALQSIDDISSKVKFIALNASIEAARAGEFGRTFAVIAREVRTLSENSRAVSSDLRRQFDTLFSEATDK